MIRRETRWDRTGVRTGRTPLVLLVAVLALGCGELRSDKVAPGAAPGASACSCEPMGAPVVDPTLLAFLSKTRSAHHDADLAEEAGDRQRALRVLERVVLGPRPGGSSPLPEVDEVIADTRARLADLRSALGDFDGALRDVDDGLRLAQASTHFRGHLFEVRGVVEERRSKALAQRGDAAGAGKARQDALAAFEQAIEIQDEVISRALQQTGSEAPAGAGSATPR